MTDLTYAHDHLRDIANRSIAAQESFIRIVQDIADLDYQSARNIFNFYRAKRLIKYDNAMGRWSVKHGALLDRDTLEHTATHGEI
jgi:hypothetical protein